MSSTINVDKIKNAAGGATVQVDEIVNISGDSDSGINLATNDNIKFNIAGSQKAIIDSSGNLLVGGTNNDDGNDGIKLRASGEFVVEQDDSLPAKINRKTSDGEIIRLQKDGSTVGDIRCLAANLHIQGTTSGLSFQGNNVITPVQNGARTDNVIDLGDSSRRFDDIHATNGTIQTSDKNEKNTIIDSDLGIDFVSRLSPKSYKFNNKTRTHYGLIAQDIETVLGDIKKDATQFAGFCKDDISEKQDGSEYRYGLRYHEFISPMIQAIKDLKAEVDTLKAEVKTLKGE